MGFFDLNVPYQESSPTEKASLRATRTKLAIKAMEMGYTGIAYNRTMKGVMSDRDRCSIPLLSLSSLMKLAPSLSSSVQLHRELLGVPRGTPFRQYTRLTVCVDGVAQGQALNSGNPVLKTYDLIAVRPLNQIAFEQACERMEVDVIAIDFSDRMPFRLKIPMVKAAIARGVYFEITYSSLIGDVQSRRQMISNAKLLVDWTRGKNLIFSSCAPSVNELRGPNDVSNLLSLFGMSMQSANATISKNCRTLLSNALRKKHFYKEAIRVEVIPSGHQMDPKNHGSVDWLKWDPISSGEGDLLLDDLAKGFSASDKPSKTVKAIDFTSVMNSMPSQGFQVKDFISRPQGVCQLPKDNTVFSCSNTVQVSVAGEGESEQSNQPDSHAEAVHTSFFDSPSEYQTSFGFPIVSSPVDCLKVISETKETTTQASTEDKLKALNESDAQATSVETEMHDMESQKHVFGFESNVLLNDKMEVELGYGKYNSDAKKTKTQTSVVEEPKTLNEADQCSVETEMHDVGTKRQVFSSNPNIELRAENILLCTSRMEIVSEDANVELYIQPEENSGLVYRNEESKSAENYVELDTLMDHDETKIDVKCQAHVSLQENISEIEQLKEPGDDSDKFGNELPGLAVESCNDSEGIDDSHLERHKMSEVKIDEQQLEHDIDINCPTLVQSTSGNGRTKQRIPRGAFMFPFKRLLNPVSPSFKRKTLKTKSRNKRV